MQVNRIALVTVVVLVSFSAGKAHAQDLLEGEAGRGNSPADASSAVAAGTAWDAHYNKARLLLRGGHFQEAAEALSRLAASAPDSGRRLLASEQSELASYWSSYGYHLELVSPGERATDVARFRDKRTTDELAWLYTTSVIYGIGSGVALAAFTEPDAPAAAILPALALSGAAAGLVYGLDRKPLRYGAAQSITSALFIGFEEGLVWLLWREEASYETDLTARQVAGYLWGATTVGAVVGGLVGQLHGITPGRASLIGSGALWSSLVVGLSAGAITDRPSTGLLAAAVALNVGAVAGFVLGDRVQPSIGRVRFLDLGVLAGGVLAGGLALAATANNADGSVFLATTAAGMVAGFATAWVMTAKMAPDDPRRPAAVALVPTLIPPHNGNGPLLGVGGIF